MRTRAVGMAAGAGLLAVVLLGSPAHAHPRGGVEQSGDLLRFVPPAAGYVATFFLGDEAGRGQFYKGFGVNLGATFALKYLVDRQRPHDHGGQSFPSGHAAIAFQGAAFIQRRYGWSYALPAYLTAGFVGWSRVYSHMHYPSDVLAGAALGVASSYLFTTPFHGVDVAPVAGDGFLGVSLSARW